MSVSVKSASEIEKMREAGRILAIVHEELEKMIRPGISTLDIDKKGEEIIRSYGCEPSFLNYQGYPASICVSVNDEVVHGIPSSKRILNEGDIVSLDAGVIYQGYHSDAARTWPVGEVSLEADRLMKVTKEAFFEGIKYARAGNRLNDICKNIYKYILDNGYSVVRDLCGHGIGKNLHEKPMIPNYKMLFRGVKLVPGMTLAIEPMVNEGNYKIFLEDDDWTVVTADGLLSSHYENTVLITEGEPEILSLR